MFFSLASQDPFFFVSWLIIITFSICIHEYAHAQMALWKGDDTAASRGHLSLNPLVQMGWMSLIMMVFIGIAWGAVPVNPRNMRGKYAEAQVAFAGPAANIILCLLFAVIQAVLMATGVSGEILLFMKLASMANGVLFLFNMLPIPMFDGWTVLASFVPAMRRIDLRKASAYSWLAIIVVWQSGALDTIWSAGAAIGGAVYRVTLAVLGGV